RVVQVRIPQRIAALVVHRILLDKIPTLATQLDTLPQQPYVGALLFDQVLEVAVGRGQVQAQLGTQRQALLTQAHRRLAHVVNQGLIR
ncbi:hypothetical protein, partial [Salmonella enterica]|uniref:hypothetical protein n=1 Tax=Salmonella enterica TaxID=28901 RepID=UPI0022B6B892